MEKKVETRASYDQFKILMKYTRYLSVFVGADIFDDEFKINVNTFTLLMLCSIAYVSYIITILDKCTISVLLQGLAFILMMSQGLYKLYANLRYRLDILHVYHYIEELHKYGERRSNLQQSLISCVGKCIFCFKIFSVAFTGLFLSHCFIPIIYHYMYSKRMEILPTSLPFVDINTTAGYVSNILHQISLLLMGCCGVLCADMVFLILISHTACVVDDFQSSMNELNEIIVSNLNDVMKIRKQLNDCLVKHQRFIGYVNNMNSAYSSNCFVQLLTSALLMILSFFLIIWNRWIIIGPFLVIISLFQLFEYCLLGTVVQIQSEKVLSLIYRCLWYLMPVKEQKIVLFILMRSQNPSELNAGKFAKLNVETCMKVLKAVYTYVMVLQEMVD